MNVIERYQEQLSLRGFKEDPAQRRVANRLQQMYDESVVFKRRRSNRLSRLLDRSPPPRGVWVWGGVGRGKSFLMDVLFDSVPLRRKTRVHWHEFMRSVHRELQTLPATANPLYVVARRLARRYRLICFDEFHVSDIADAMILDRLMHGLFEYGVTFVVTSNYPPDGLYPDGLHRDRMLPAIELLKERLDVIELDAVVDFRRLSLTRDSTYLSSIGSAAEDRLALVFAELAAGEVELAPTLLVAKRHLQARRCAGPVVWFDFETLCAGPRSQLDYLELADRFDSLVLSGVPQMTSAMSAEARRFTWLIDVLYDRKVKLVMAAECAPELLYTGGVWAYEFARTVSRLLEMQSRAYLEAPRRESKGLST